MSSTIKISVVLDMLWLLNECKLMKKKLDARSIEMEIIRLVSMLSDQRTLNPRLSGGAEMTLAAKQALFLNFNGSFNPDAEIQNYSGIGMFLHSLSKHAQFQLIPVLFGGELQDAILKYEDFAAYAVGVELSNPDNDFVFVAGSHPLLSKIIRNYEYNKLVLMGPPSAKREFHGLHFHTFDKNKIRMFKDYEEDAPRPARILHPASPSQVAA